MVTLEIKVSKYILPFVKVKCKIQISAFSLWRIVPPDD